MAINNNRNLPAKVLSEELAAFISQGVSITAASRDNRFIPSISRVLACKVNDQRDQISLYLVKSQALQLLCDIRQTQTLAVVFSLPSSHRTVQIKGVNAVAVEVCSDEIPLIETSTAAFAKDIGSLGYSHKFAQAFHAFSAVDLIAVRFDPQALFEQSPGPNAGKPLEFAL